MSSFPEDPTRFAQIREFDIGQVHIRQQGRISELNHPAYGATYLIDVTDQEDFSDAAPGEPGEVIREIFGTKLFNPAFYESYSRNNGTVAVISRSFSLDQRPRVYIGQDIVYDKQGHPDLTSTLINLPLKKGNYYVPMSIEPERVILQVAMAEKELVGETPFKGIHKKFIYEDPNPEEFYEKGEYAS